MVFKCSWGHCIFPRAFENNSLCKIGEGGGGKQNVLWCIKKWRMACTNFVTFLALSSFLEKTLLHFEAVMNPSPHIAIALSWRFQCTERQQLPKLLPSKCLLQS